MEQLIRFIPIREDLPHRLIRTLAVTLEGGASSRKITVGVLSLLPVSAPGILDSFVADARTSDDVVLLLDDEQSFYNLCACDRERANMMWNLLLYAGVHIIINDEPDFPLDPGRWTRCEIVEICEQIVRICEATEGGQLHDFC